VPVPVRVRVLLYDGVLDVLAVGVDEGV